MISGAPTCAANRTSPNTLLAAGGSEVRGKLHDFFGRSFCSWLLITDASGRGPDRGLVHFPKVVGAPVFTLRDVEVVVYSWFLTNFNRDDRLVSPYICRLRPHLR